ncbi:hypothetical protein, partial [Prochlorothrix hollandica]|uniref:hypothetical protein n=1 Tax=Prochlorothrix hollandica TaxID=1223 RepID=UPI003340B31F
PIGPPVRNPGNSSILGKRYIIDQSENLGFIPLGDRTKAIAATQGQDSAEGRSTPWCPEA